MRRLIFSILTGFAGIAAWGQTPVAAHPTAANDTLTEDSTYALQEVVVRTSPVKQEGGPLYPVRSSCTEQRRSGTPSASTRSMVVRRADFH